MQVLLHLREETRIRQGGRKGLENHHPHQVLQLNYLPSHCSFKASSTFHHSNNSSMTFKSNSSLPIPILPILLTCWKRMRSMRRKRSKKGSIRSSTTTP